jgi:hypothetical protein
MDEFEDNEEPGYRRPNEIQLSELHTALSRLELFDDPSLRMQAVNLAIVDQFITELEYGLLKKLVEEDGTPSETVFVLAQSEMWIFAAYELMRTWRQRAKEMIKWHENGALDTKLKHYEKKLEYPHFANEIRAHQIRRVLQKPELVQKMNADLRLIHMAFVRLEAIRISIAKHEVRGQKGSLAMMPGYGRINRWCGSLDFELEDGTHSLGCLSRRDIADDIRALAIKDVPTEGENQKFDSFMRGPRRQPV